ncbi:MAG: HD domain-containing protein, partial [Nitrososphaeraceae archaeon]|nr:HD domain-containing protein [Nitrososphaeraceae archaeon]
MRVVSDDEVKLFSEKQNVATTSKELISKKENPLSRKKNYQFVVCIPQWLVLDTDFSKFSPIKSSLDITDDSQLVTLINSINNQLINATGEIIEQERQRIKYPWKIGTFLIFLNKSLPIRIVYNEILYKLRKDIPGQKKSLINEANLNLAYLTNKELIDAIILLASMRGISKESIDKIDTLLKFLDNAYKKQGLGDGSNKYHNFHHSLEVAFVGLQFLPKKLNGYEFSSKDFEILIIAGLLHDYDPLQRYDNKLSIGLGRAEGPRVERTIQELSRNKIHEAYFLLNSSEFRNYFDDYYSYSLPPLKYNTTHPEYLKHNQGNNDKDNGKIAESIIIESMILRTDYPYYLKIDSQNKFKENLKYLDGKGLDTKRYEILAEVLWLADLSVVYTSSDPLNAWNRVINLYDELYLPKSTIITQTDMFFSQFI